MRVTTAGGELLLDRGLVVRSRCASTRRGGGRGRGLTGGGVAGPKKGENQGGGDARGSEAHGELLPGF